MSTSCASAAEYAITDVGIKAKLSLRGTAAPRKELRDWH
jgi:hypothetical protein